MDFMTKQVCFDEVRNDLMDDWIWLKLNGISIADYCRESGLTRVAIFGADDLGLLIYNDLLSGGIQAVAFLDYKAEYNDFRCYDIPVLDPNGEEKINEQADIFIVTFSEENEEVVALIRESYNSSVVFISNIVKELQKNVH